MNAGLQIIQLSPTQGYVQTPGNDKLRHYWNLMNEWLSLHPPVDHISLLSLSRLDIHDRNSHVLEVYDGGKVRGNRVWLVRGIIPPRPRLMATREIYVHFMTGTYYESKRCIGFRLLFSYHLYLHRPSCVRSGLWNCSVPDWPEFQRHFLCNVEVECDGGEDEVPCYYTGHCGLGQITLNDRCYTYIYNNGTKLSWSDAYLECHQQEPKGGYLASLNTPTEWQAVLTVLRKRRSPNGVFVGLYRSPSSMPLMYKGSLMWADRSIVYFYKIYTACLTYRGPLASPSSTMCGRKDTFDLFCERDSHDEGEKTKDADIDKLSLVHMWIQQNESLAVPSVACPKGHVTHAFLACDEQSACWLSPKGFSESASRGVPTAASCPAPMTSLPATFSCSSGWQHVPYSSVCDHSHQCADGSDESFCVFSPCSGSTPIQCDVSNQCVSLWALCDGEGDCRRDTDEVQCDIKFVYELVTLPPPAVVSFTPVRATGDEEQFPFVVKPVPFPDSPFPCPETHFQCPANGYCLPVFVRCNGVNDCPGREDEAGCDSVSCPGFYRCRSSAVCLHPSHVCDDKYQCPEQDDERFCRLSCPEGCSCHGLEFTCRQPFYAALYSDMRYLDASSSGMTQEDLSENILLIHLSLSGCGVDDVYNMTFPNLRSLDLSLNELFKINAHDLVGIQNLQYMSLSNNPLKVLFQSGSQQPLMTSLRTLDLSGVRMRRLITHSFSSFPDLHTLNLSHCVVETVAAKALHAVHKLRVLNVEGCPMSQFPRDLFSGLNLLQAVKADNFKVCCSDTLPPEFNPAGCRAPIDEVSSCESLLRSDIYRIFMSVFSILALMGNLGSFLMRTLILKSSASGFGVFVTHLSTSDFLMGGYLAMIGIADRLYIGSYVWEDISWRHSATCNIAGFLSLLSNEVSAFIICLITLDRFLVLRFPFSRLHFRPLSAHVTCFLVWMVGVAMAAAPLTPMMSHWSFYSQTGICVPLPVNRGDFAGRHYAFGILIVFNFILFVLIAAGQASIYVTVRANSLSKSESTKKSTDLRIASRLITVAMSDFLCWFPIGLLGLLASRGVPIPGEVNVGMAILVLPLNSALNPFLYTINVIMDRRKRSRDEQLLKQLMAQIIEEDVKDTE